jgi:HD-GYP domain-containing protein (c-di-GMP phosphodiesterase class II)
MPSISVDRLQPGVFVSLEGVAWLDHPFLLNSFRITNEKQIETLRQLGVANIEWVPAKSKAGPLPEKKVTKPVEPDFGAQALQALMQHKRQRAAQVSEQRERFARCERQFEQETATVGQALRDIHSMPNESFGRARATVGRLNSGLLAAQSVAVHLVNLKSADTGAARHAMNVMVLALLAGKALGLDAEEMNHVGLGAIFHDIGKVEIPPRVLRSTCRTPPEEQFYQAHIGYGIKHVTRVRDLPLNVKNVVACHHERWDGAGFPNHLAGSKIPRLARIVAIANRYDNLCNPFDLAQARTPAEAVAQMFRQEAGAFDPEILQAFVRSLGVYPPGSFVALSDGSIGLVVESNPKDSLHPTVMIHDEKVPRTEALLVDLREAELAVESAVNPAKLPVAVVEYLAPRGRIDYYIDAA